MATIHPTAVVDPAARIGEDVVIGPGVVVEGETAIGAGCRLMAHSVVRRFTTLGERNVLHPFVVLGGEPQDYGFDEALPSFLVIGNGNVFREGVTVNRATGENKVTRVGDDNYFMTAAHVGHNVTVGSHCIFINGSAVAGHAEVHDRAILSAHVGVHQFCWVGEMVIARGQSGASQHVPPYCMLAEINVIAGLNRVGLRRAPDLSDQDRREIQEAYRLTYRSGLTTPRALSEMDAHAEWGAAAGKFREFVRRVLSAQGPFRRGLCGGPGRRRSGGENEE